MTPRPIPLTGLFLAAAVLGAHGPTGCGDDAACPACDAPSSTGALQNPDLAETSGVAASAAHDGVFYAHNDAGHPSRFHAFSRDGADLGTYKVQDAQNVDWEDMAQGPCGAGSCLFLADIGDNARERLAYTLYRLAEPATIAPGEQSLPADRIVFTYPDGSHDAEAVLVHPVTGVVTIVTKTDGPAAIFELAPPLTTDRTHMAVQTGEVTAPDGGKFTGGAVHPDATGLVLRTSKGLHYYAMAPGQSAAEALAGDPCQLPVADEKNGEAVTWLPAGAGLMTVGEGVGARLHVASCAP